MPLNHLFGKQDRSQISPRMERSVPLDSLNANENDSLLHREADVDNTNTDDIRLLDMSADKKWICYVSQYKDSAKMITTSLSIRRFTAITEEMSEIEDSTAISGDNSSSTLHGINIQIESDAEVRINSIYIDQYLDISDNSYKFLSISSNGRYVTLSTFAENKKDKEGSCFIFLFENNVISLHSEIKCNGRAVFLNRDNGLFLAIINTETIRIYEKIMDFSKEVSYRLYDLRPFGSKEDFMHTRFQSFYTDYLGNWASENRRITSSTPKKRHIISLSALIEFNVLLTPFIQKSDTIRFWSLKNNGIRLGSIVAPGDAVIAISRDFKYAATTKPLFVDTKSVIRVHNLENGSLVYTLKSDNLISKMAHATFCFDSRYLAISAVSIMDKTRSSIHLDRNTAIFEVWYVEGETPIYSTRKSLGLYLPSTLDSKEIKSLKPFISEEITDDNRRILKGFYVYTDSKGITTTRSVELKLDDQQNNAIQWLSKDDPTHRENDDSFELFSDVSSESDLDDVPTDIDEISAKVINPENDIFSINNNNPENDTLIAHNSSSVNHTSSADNINLENSPKYSNNHISDDQLNQYLDSALNGYLQGRDYERYEIIDNIYNYERLKCGQFEVKGNKYFLRCGKHMIQLWQVYDINNLRSHDLVYIKPYTNSDCRSFYLSPNIWRIQTFRSIKFVSGGHNPRVIVNIIEDDIFLEKRKSNFATYTEEFILPIPNNSGVFNYHVFEGACQTLYYLNICSIEESELSVSRTYVDKNYKEQLESMLEKTESLIETEIKKIDESCISFKTTAASKTLSMLASFEKGRDVLKLLLKNETVIFNLSRYSVTTAYGARTINLTENDRYNTIEFRANRINRELNYFTDQIKYRNLPGQTLMKEDAKVMDENVLIILIREREYHLYNLLLNRILSDSKMASPECLSILNETLLLLQELKNTDQLEKTSQKLSCLAIRTGSAGPLLPLEMTDMIPDKADLRIEGNFILNIGSMHYFSSLEQMKILKPQEFEKNSLYTKTINATNQIISDLLALWIALKSIWRKTIQFFKYSNTKPSNQFMTCVVPLPYFNTYYRTTVRDAHLDYSEVIRKEGGLWNSPHKKESTFLQLALNQRSEFNIWKQGDDVMAVMLQYKWKAFIRKRFYYIFVIHMIYYITYCVGVQFALEKYKYDSTNPERSIAANSQHLACIIIFFLSDAILLLLEINQIPRSRYFYTYFKSWYNYVDLVAIVLPVITFIQLVLNIDYFYEVSSVCTLILWLHGIIRLRVFSSFGIALETIIQLFQKVISVLLILLLVIFGFTHSFIVLLRQRLDQYFQENYGGETSLSSSNNESTSTGETTLYDLSSSNGFSDPFKALYHVWLFIFGVWDPVTGGDAGDNRMLFILCMLFAFITVLIFTNMIIALMSSTVEEVKRRGKKVWMTHFAAVIAEIEALTLKSTKHDRVNNPAFIFYSVNYEKVKKHEEILRQETQELRRGLMIDEDEHMKALVELNAKIDFLKARTQE